MTNINKITHKQHVSRSRVSCRMHGRGQTVPSSRAPVHAPSHTPPFPPPLLPPPSPSFSRPLLCPPPFRVPCWPRAESGGAMGGRKWCLHAAPHVAVPCRLVRAPPVG